jgi:hypothetical protein
MNYGNSETYRGSNIFILDNKQIPTEDLTIFNWDFGTVTGSDASGNMIVEDITSGSTDTIYGWIDNIIRRENRGKGYNFGASKTSFVENEYLYSLKKEMPEISFTNDNIFIKGDREKFFIKDEDVSDNFYMVEKSLNQVISEEMLKSFSTVQEFANLIARPVDRYRQNYKRLEKVKEQFFAKVTDDPSVENFINYFKWIDGSISRMIEQLIPATVNFGAGVTDVVESHILERNKYQRRPGLLTTIESTDTAARGIEELTYNWKAGHAPVDLTKQNQNCLWQKERKERDDIPDRETIRKAITTETKPPKYYFTGEKTFSSDDGSTYAGSTYAIRRLSRPYKFAVDFNNSIHGGINYNQQKNRDFYRSTIAVHGPIGASGAPRNIIGIGIGTTDGINEKQKCDDILDPNLKSYYDATVQVGSFTADSSGHVPHDDSASYSYRIKSSNWWPFNVKSGSVASGYNTMVSSSFRSDAVIVNLHSDTIDITNEIPIQGPYTQAHVGGHQGRHVDLNKYDTTLRTEGGSAPSNNIDDKYTRPEAYRLLLGDNPYNSFTPDGAMGLTGPDYGGPYPNITRKWAIYYREERAKRPVSIKNIQTTTASTVHGNFQHHYETLSTFGSQKYLLRRQNGSLLPSFLSSSLPQTTNYMTLMGITPMVSGNVFGQANNNRQPDGNGSPGASATGQFTVTGAYVAGTNATGSFKYYSRETAGFNDTSNWDNNQITFGGDNFFLDKDGTADSPPNYYVATGSGIAIQYNNLRNKINSIGAYAATYTQVNKVMSAINLGTSIRDAPNPFLSASTNLLDELEYTWVFNIKLNSTSSTGYNQYLFTTVTGAAGSPDTSQELYIDSTGALKYKILFQSGSGNPERSTTFTKSNFTGSMSFAAEQPPDNLILSHKYTTSGPSTGDIKVYLNNTSISMTQTNTGALVTNQQTSRIKNDGALYLFSNKAADFSNFAGTASVAAFFKDDLGTTQIQNAYNNKYYKDYSNLEAVSNALLVSQWNLDNTEGISGSSPFIIAASTGSTPINLTASAPAVAAARWGYLADSGVREEPYANFMLTGSATGSAKNSAISITATPSTYNYFEAKENIAGGTDQSGIFATNRILLDSSAFLIVSTPTSDYSSTYHVVNTGSSTEIWESLKEKIITNTVVQSIVTSSTGTQSCLFKLTASIGTAGNTTISAVNSISPASFTSLSGMAGGVDAIYANDIVREIPRSDLTSSRHIIQNRFSAPGGPEVNSRGYRDIATGEYSVYNAINYRNLSIRGSGSGETGTIRINSHADRRDGLMALRTRHQGRFGIDSVYGSVSAVDYNAEASYFKQHRNTLVTPRSSSSDVVNANVYDNVNVTSLLPRSDFQYSWINSTISGSNWLSDQKVFGYAPRDGMLSSSVGYDSAITFPSASTLYGE